MKVLFIAYYFEPFPGVGAKRISYWAKNIKRIDDSITRCDVITATKQDSIIKGIDNIYYVEDTNSGVLRKLIKYDRGASWYYDLKKYIKNNIREKEYDYVVYTGDPFLHFFTIREIKNLHIKTILDFRDPFSNNPRNTLNISFVRKIKMYILGIIEEYFLKKADIIITVNSFCAELFRSYKKYITKIKIIDNGFDEQLLIKINKKKTFPSQSFNLSYAGKLYQDRNPQIFFNSLKRFKNAKFYHIGEKSEYIEEETEQIFSLGSYSYVETLNILSSMDICMIFTSGYSFESTTKIFDYIALNKIILIISDGEIKSGQLHNITKDYPYVYWAKNDIDEITKALSLIENKLSLNMNDSFNSYSYSREYGLKKLINILKENKNDKL